MKIAIVEDEDSAANGLENCLQQYAKEKNMYINTVRFIDPTALLKQYKPLYDLIFMDIVMPHVNGFTASQKLRETDEDVMLVFVTNMQNYAIKGYEVGAFDFIVKPVTYNVFRTKMNRIVKALSVREKDRTTYVSVNGVTRVLFLRDIYYVEISGHTLTYHTKNGDISVRESMERAEQALGGDFVRCNKCYLVNLAHVSGTDQNTVSVAGIRLVISRNRRKAFLDALADYFGKRV